MRTHIQPGIIRQRLAHRGLNVVITGADGSGKTTLANELVHALRAENLPSKKLHIFAWYSNLFLVPFLLVRNKYVDRSVLILDRSIYDNLAVLAAKRKRNIHLLTVGVLKFLYPRFDFAFYLHADQNETLKRRPHVDPDWHQRLTTAYQQLVKASGHTVLQSDSQLFPRVVAALHGDTVPSGV